MGNTAPIMEAKGKIDYGLTNDYMFRAILQKKQKNTDWTGKCTSAS